MNMKVDEVNGKSAGMVNGGYQKVRQFLSNSFCKNIGGLVSASTFGIGGLRLWEKEYMQNIIGKKRKKCSIMMNVSFYEVCISYIIYCLPFYLLLY